MQDRIIGPLTMIQFMYAVIGGGFCYGILMSGMPKILSYIIVVPSALFIMAMIFLKVNERPFLDFFVSVLEFSSSPKKRIWHHENIADLNVEVVKPKTSINKPVTTAKQYTHEDIKRLAQQIDPGEK